MLETLGKYIIENHRDFYDAIQYLKENNVQPIKFNLNNDTEKKRLIVKTENNDIHFKLEDVS